MADLVYPFINGNRYDFSSIELGLLGKQFLGLKSIDYSHALTPGEVRGTHAQQLGATRGKYDANASIELFLSEYNELIAALGDGYLERRFTMTVNYRETGLPLITDRLVGVKIVKPQKSGQSGSEDASAVKCDLHVFYVIENGKKPLDNMKL